MLKLRPSSCSPVFLGEDGLTDKQSEMLDELMNKIKLTEKQAEKRDELIVKRDAPVELSAGAKTLIEEYVDRMVYDYYEDFSNPKTQKGWAVEDASIEIYNRLFFTDHKKLVEGDQYYELEYGILKGHPDVVDVVNKRVIDIKSSWTKKTFPKTKEKAYDIGYQWQVKTYLYILTKMTGEQWRHGEVAHVLVTTPEDIKPEWENDSLHYADNLDDNLRVTICDVELTDADIKKIEGRVEVAIKYANEYYQQLNNKNK
jgi:hypothetical protein